MKASDSIEDFEKTFSKNLRLCREKSGYTQKHVSKVTGIPLPILVNMEAGKFEGEWRFGLFMKICAFYGYKPNEMSKSDFVFESKAPIKQ